MREGASGTDTIKDGLWWKVVLIRFFVHQCQTLAELVVTGAHVLSLKGAERSSSSRVILKILPALMRPEDCRQTPHFGQLPPDGGN